MVSFNTYNEVLYDVYSSTLLLAVVIDLTILFQ